MLELEEVEVRYGPVIATRSVSMTVNEGEIVAIIGPNGAGKTSLLSAIIGLIPIRRGRIRFEGRSIAGLSVESIVRSGISLTPEGRRVFTNLTVEENLSLGAASRRDRKRVHADREAVLQLFPMLSERLHLRAGTLSGGQQQQLAVGRSLMSAPRLLLLDEPSLGLAPVLVDELFDRIAILREQGTTMVIVEQHVSEVLGIADTAHVMSTGRIRYSGPASSLRSETDLSRFYLGSTEN